MILKDAVSMKAISEAGRSWVPPQITGNIPHGDMPGDKVEIGPDHIHKANVLFPLLLQLLQKALTENPSGRAVIGVCGGSGVGKSEIASILNYYLSKIGIGSYTLSGDNYPHRIPRENDAKRLEIYQNQGESGLRAYLGSQQEIDFTEMQQIVNAFKSGERIIRLKRMGRECSELWYDNVDFAAVSVLLIEWTHSNSDNFTGVDIPILLNSTPEETLAHRRARARDGAVDSPFTTMVLRMEQNMLNAQAHKAKLIITKQAQIISYDEFCHLMGLE